MRFTGYTFNCGPANAKPKSRKRQSELKNPVTNYNNGVSSIILHFNPSKAAAPDRIRNIRIRKPKRRGHFQVGIDFYRHRPRRRRGPRSFRRYAPHPKAERDLPRILSEHLGMVCSFEWIL